MKIEIARDDWLYNAGITGLLRIFGKADKLKKIKINYDSISFDLNLFRGFENDFFDYARTRVSSLEWRLNSCKIISAVLKGEAGANLEGEAFTKYRSETHRTFSGYKNLTKNKPELVKAVSSAVNVKELREATEAIELYLSKNQKKFEIGDARVFLMMDFFSGISCFNSTFKGDPVKKFKESFLDVLFTPEKKNKSKHICTTCGAETTEKIFLDAGILKPFCVSRFKSKNFYWNNNPDAYICPICRLVYLCVFAGLNPYHKRKEYGHFIFLDSDLSIKDNLRNNDTFLNLITETKRGFGGKFRDVSVDLNIKKGRELDSGFFFAEISVEKTKSLKIDFKTPVNIGELFCKRNDALFNGLRSFKYKDGSRERYVLEETIEALLNNANLEYLIAKLLKDSLNDKNNRQKDLYSLIKIENIRRTLDIEKREEGEKVIKALLRQGEIYGERILERNFSINSVKSHIFKILFPVIANNNETAQKKLSSFYSSFNHKNLTEEEKVIFAGKDNLFILAYLNGLIGAVNEKRNDELVLEEENVA